MLQQDEPDDYVIATGVTHYGAGLCESVRARRAGLRAIRDRRPELLRPPDSTCCSATPRRRRGSSAGRRRPTSRRWWAMMVDADLTRHGASMNRTSRSAWRRRADVVERCKPRRRSAARGDDRLAMDLPRLCARQRRARVARSATPAAQLGALWQILSPLAMIAIYTIVFSGLMKTACRVRRSLCVHDLRVQRDSSPGRCSSEIVVRSQTMFLENANLLKKSSFPRSSRSRDRRIERARELRHRLFVFLGTPRIVVGAWPGVVDRRGARSAAVCSHSWLWPPGVFLGIVHVFFRDVGHVLAIAAAGMVLADADRLPRADPACRPTRSGSGSTR